MSWKATRFRELLTVATLLPLFGATSASAIPEPTAGPLRVHPNNPRYFTDGTKNRDGSLRAVYLSGSHTWGNLCDYRTKWPPFDYAGYLDFLQRYNHNFIRLWAGDGRPGHLECDRPLPFLHGLP